MNVTYSRGETPFQLDVEKLPPKALEYLLQYGFAQSMQDSIAGAAKAKREELMATDQFAAMPKDEQEGWLSDEVELHVMGKLEARMAAIAEGTIGTRGPSVAKDPVAKLAAEQVRAALAKRGVKIDVKTESGKAQFAKLVADHVAKSGDKLRAEIARREAEATEVEIDL